MQSYTGAVRMDVLMPVIQDVQKQESSLPSFSRVQRAVSIGRRASTWCVSRSADFAIWLIRRRARRIEESSLTLEGAKAKLYRGLVERALPGPPEALEPLRSLFETSTKAVEEGTKLIELLRSINPSSRVAVEVERVNALFASVCDTVSEMIDLIEEGRQYADQLASIRSAGVAMDVAIAAYGDDTEIDPELMSLAEEAVQAIHAQAKATNQS